MRLDAPTTSCCLQVNWTNHQFRMKSLLSILLCFICIAIAIPKSFGGFLCYDCTEIRLSPVHHWDLSKLCKDGAGGGFGKKWVQTTLCPSTCSTTETLYGYNITIAPSAFVRGNYTIYTHGCSTFSGLDCKDDLTFPTSRPFNASYVNRMRKECPCTYHYCSDVQCVQCFDPYDRIPFSAPPGTCVDWENNGKPTIGKFAVTCLTGCETTTYMYNYKEGDNLITVTGSRRGCKEIIDTDTTCVDSTGTEKEGMDKVKSSLEAQNRTLNTFSAATCGCDGDFCNDNNEAKEKVDEKFKGMEKAENAKEPDETTEGTADVMAKSSSTNLVWDCHVTTAATILHASISLWIDYNSS